MKRIFCFIAWLIFACGCAGAPIVLNVLQGVAAGMTIANDAISPDGWIAAGKKKVLQSQAESEKKCVYEDSKIEIPCDGDIEIAARTSTVSP